MKNELARVLEIVEAYRRSGTTRARFARSRRLHPSALSRILRVGDLPPDFLRELSALERLSRTHLEVLATAPPERRASLLDLVRRGRSTYRIRERRETTQAPAAPLEAAPRSPAPPSSPETPACSPAFSEVARALGASDEEALAFASELLVVLFRSGRGRVASSFRAFREASRRETRPFIGRDTPPAALAPTQPNPS